MPESGRKAKDLLKSSPNRFAQSRGSLQSNEIMIVEEVNDNEISNEAFMIIRDCTKSGMANSMHEGSLDEMRLLGDGELNKLQHTGSLREEASSHHQRQNQSARGISATHPISSISSIQQSQNNTNNTFLSHQHQHHFHQHLTHRPQPQAKAQQQRVVQKVLISDLNMAHPAALPLPQQQCHKQQPSKLSQLIAKVATTSTSTSRKQFSPPAKISTASAAACGYQTARQLWPPHAASSS